MRSKFFSIYILIIAGFILFYKPELGLAEQYKLKAELKDCAYGYTAKVNSGTHFGITAKFTNSDIALNLPLTIWLIYDNKVCDKKELDKTYYPGETIFGADCYLGCDVELPGVPAEAKKIDRSFKIKYTLGKQNPIAEGVLIYSGNTKEFCRVCVE